MKPSGIHNKLSILYFAPCGLAEGVGGGARLRNMLDVLARLETNTQLISYLPGEKFEITHNKISDCLNTTIISTRRSSPKVLKLLALVQMLIYGFKNVKKSDIVFAHAPTIASGFPAFVLAKIFRKPLLIDHMDIKDPDTPKFIHNCVLKNSNIVLTISRYLEEEVKQIGCKNVVYVPVFVDIDVFQKDTLARAEMLEKLGIDDKEIVVGYTGSFAHIEGLPFLLKAFKSLSNKYENIRLVVIGGRNVPDSDDIAGLINELALNDRAILVHPQPHELMPKYLSTFDIACSPKIDCAENRAANPIKIYEYMSMALPTIVSAVGEISNIIENGYDGFLVKPGDVNDLEGKLEYVIQNADSAQEVGRRAREKIIRHYSHQAMLERIENTLKQLSNQTTSTNS